MKEYLRIGLSMRVTTEEFPNGIREKRDTVAHNWPLFLQHALPEALWVPLPNAHDGRDSVRMAQELGLQGLILTGGNDFGAEPSRDNTEFALLSWAKQWKLPVIGICRGAHMLNVFCGGAISALQRGPYCADERKETVAEAKSAGDTPEQQAKQALIVHKYGILGSDISREFTPLSMANDGYIEAFSHKALPWLGLLWHPEREVNPREEDVALFQDLFLHKKCLHLRP